jgi:protein-tyrosine kinase
MSRIHDALKKAEQEKATRGTPEGSVETHVPSALDLNPPETAPPVAGEGMTASTESKAGPDDSSLDLLLASCSRHDWDASAAPALPADGHRQALVSEEFRTLRSRLYLMRKRQPLQKLLITSPLPQEGKTFIALGLAQAIVRQPRSRVLLIDADLRLSGLHAALGAPSAPGLAEYLAGEANETAVLQRGSLDNFFFIPGGERVPNPLELVGNGRLKLLMNLLAPAFDWIIIDSPPVIPVSDAKLVAQYCDGVLMLVKAGATPFDLAQKACQEFPKTLLLGVVLNGAEPQPHYGSYYYYGGKNHQPRNDKG